MEEKRFRKGTHVTIICGIHSFPDGTPEKAESSLVFGYNAVFSRLQDRHGSVIKEMKYIVGTVMPIDTLRTFERINGKRVEKYYLSDGSKAAIQGKFEDLIDNKKPQFFIFATCYSVRSQINEILRSSGLISVLSLKQEKGEITEGKIYELDEGQKEVLKIVAEEQPKNIILWGSSGTGKTILLTEALSMKVNHYKKEGIKIKIIVSSWVGNPSKSNVPLMEDFKEKYLYHLVSEEENIEFMLFFDLCSGIFIFTYL